MQARFFLLNLVLALSVKICLAGEVPPPTLYTLPNGLRVIVKAEAGSGLAAINLVIRAGSRHEETEAGGAAHFLEHMLFRGSRNYRPGEAEKLVEGLGGAANAGTLRDFTHVYATVPSAAFEQTLAALADAVLYPDLDSVEMERERAVILSEIARQNESPRATLWDLAHLGLFLPDGHPYGRPVNGLPESVLRLGREDLVRFHHHWYVPNNMALVVAGDVTEAKVLAAARKAFGRLERGPASQAAAPKSAGARLGELTYQHGGTIAYLGLAVKGPGISSPQEVCALDILQALLAGGSQSRLSSDLRPLAIAAGAEFLTSREPSPFMVWAACRPENTAEVKTRLAREIARLAKGDLTPAEIAVARRQVETSFWLSNETCTDQADVLGFYEGIDSYRSAAEYIPHLRALSVGEVKEAAKRYLDTDKGVWIMLVPQTARKESVAGSVSSPLCGGGLGWGEARRTFAPFPPPPVSSPIKGEGTSFASPAPRIAQRPQRTEPTVYMKQLSE